MFSINLTQEGTATFCGWLALLLLVAVPVVIGFAVVQQSLITLEMAGSVALLSGAFYFVGWALHRNAPE